MDLDAAKAPLCDGMPDHLPDTAGIAPRMDAGEADEAAGVARRDPRHTCVRARIIGVLRSEDHSSVDSSSARPAQVWLDRRFGAPMVAKTFAFAGVTVTVDDHRRAPPEP